MTNFHVNFNIVVLQLPSNAIPCQFEIFYFNFSLNVKEDFHSASNAWNVLKEQVKVDV